MAALSIAIVASCTSGGGGDAASGDGGVGNAASDAATPSCWSADAGPPPDATPAEAIGVVGACCESSATCVSNSACVSGRCCIHLRDSGRRCTADSDCCSGKCPTTDDADAGWIAGECVPYGP